MKFQARPYHNRQDLLDAGSLIREAYDTSPTWNTWSPFRYDTWAYRQIGEEDILGKIGWQKDFFRWEDEKGHFCGVLFFEEENSAVLICLPEYPELYEKMLVQAEAHFSRKGIEDKPFKVEVLEKNNFAEALLKARGYEKPGDCMIYREKLLNPSTPEPVRLPSGYIFKIHETEEDLVKYLAATETVFTFHDNPAVYRTVQSAPSFVPELALLVLSREGEVASFCGVWVDKERSISEFEPVGTVPEFRQRGLGVALLAEAHNRLRALGIRLATVCSYSGALPANRLYDSAGLDPRDKLYTWHKNLPL